MRRCFKRGKELQLPHLVAFARLALAQFTWQHRIIPPTKSTGTRESPSPTEFTDFRFGIIGFARRFAGDAVPTLSREPGGVEDVVNAMRILAA